jgi:alpha-glucosidase (family GH31 glycosyl hydrolase)
MLRNFLCRAISLVFLLPALDSCLLAEVHTLESPALRLEVNDNPYFFRVIERSTGEVLLLQSSTSFKFGNQIYPAGPQAEITASSDRIQAALHLQASGHRLPAEASDKAQVTFTFTSPEILQVVLRPESGTAAAISEEFKDQAEHYYGIWENPFGGDIDNRGARQDFLGIQHQPDGNYDSARAPFYVTSKKYGVYVESTAQGHYSIARAGKTTFAFNDSQLKYHIIYGPSYGEVFSRYNAMAGPAIMPPLWAFSTIWWRDDHHDDLRGVHNAQEKVIHDADRLRQLHIPASAIWLDRPFGTGEHGWGNMDFDASFPDPPRMISDLKDRGMNLLIWIANRCSSGLYREGSEKGYLFPDDWPAADMRRPEIYNWFQEKLNSYVKVGVKGYKIDRGEEAEMPRSLENLNAILYPKMADEGMAKVYGKDYFIFSRNANDTARKYTAIWNGDTQPTFGGLAVSVKDALRSGAINFPMWGSDTGGYLGDPDKEVFARWLAFSAYSSMMEILIGPKRTVWDDFDEELVNIARKYSTAHHDLIPYARSYMYAATQSGMPVMRSLIFAYPDDKKLFDTWDEYLFGADILVAPITKSGATERTVYLPAGRWIDYNDKKTVYTGPVSISVNAPLATIPLFVREGAVIPRGDILKANNNWDANWQAKLRIEFFPSSKTPSEFAFFTGDKVQKINATRKGTDLEISFDDLGTNGNLEIYCRNPKAVTKNGSRLKTGDGFQYDSSTQKLTIPFEGTTKVVISAAAGVFRS